jgi:hypothetical protein
MSNPPPPLHQLMYLYNESENSSHLRFGQWFMVNYLRKQHDSELFYTNDNKKAMDIITKYYKDYQW